ncbi:MAG: hypothetical protein V1872_03735 [bacterium]
MGFVEKEDVQRLLQDENFMEDIVHKVVTEPDFLDLLAESITDELSKILENDVKFNRKIRKKLIDIVINNEEFKKRVVNNLVEELED